jgi:hypothetical protein
MDLLLQIVRMAIRAVTISVVVLFSVFFVHFLIVSGAFDGPFLNPYEAEDICFVRDTPGATSRYVEYTFVTCSTPHVPLGPSMGSDQAVLTFEDIDRDGRPEAVVESSRYKCRFGQLGCYGAYRIVARICGTCTDKVRVHSEENLAELERR